MLLFVSGFISSFSFLFNIGCFNIYGYIGCLNIEGTHVTANNSTNNNFVFYFVSDSSIVKLATLVKGDQKAPF